MGTYAYNASNNTLTLIAGVPKSRLNTIEGNITSKQESTTTATSPYTVGQYISYGNPHKFAVVTQSLSIGDTIPHGTNVTDISIGDVLTSLKSDIYSAISSSSTYKPKGTCAFNSLPTLIAEHEGWVVNVNESFTTTSDFVEGANKTYPTGTNVVVINAGDDQNPVYKYDVLAGFIDLSLYALASSIPSDLADLSDDSTHRLVTDTEKSTWNNKQDSISAGNGISISQNVVSVDSLQSGDMDEIITPLPSTRKGYHKYSTDEQVVGTWIDGKPLYEKTVEITIPTTTADGTYKIEYISHGCSNVDLIFITNAFIIDPISVGYTRALLYLLNNGTQIKISSSTTSFQVVNGVTTYNGADAYITIQYTKTTD